jgi:hypothetical protein
MTSKKLPPIPAHLAAYPWYAPHQAWLKAEGRQPGHAVPRGTVAKRADLRGANLSHANLERAYLSFTSFSRANLSGANLSGANLTGANFTGALWMSTTCPNGAVTSTGC